VSERIERALTKTSILAMNPAKWLQTAKSTTDSFFCSNLKNAHNLASLGAAFLSMLATLIFHSSLRTNMGGASLSC